MRDNWNTQIVGHRVLLVPYRRKFVLKYHSWMQDQYVLEMTASDSLSLEEEYNMQETWRDDPNKCTFIVLQIGADDKTEIERMVGDVNLFMHDSEDPTNAEIDVMIPDTTSRRKGYAREAVTLMIQYGAKKLGIVRFFAKINETNDASLGLFKSMGFVEVKYVDVFQEYELELLIGSEAGMAILESAVHSSDSFYPDQPDSGVDLNDVQNSSRMRISIGPNEGASGKATATAFLTNLDKVSAANSSSSATGDHLDIKSSSSSILSPTIGVFTLPSELCTEEC